MAGPSAKGNRKTSPGMFSRLHLTVECPTEFGQTVHVSGSSFLAGLRYPSLVRFVFSCFWAKSVVGGLCCAVYL